MREIKNEEEKITIPMYRLKDSEVGRTVDGCLVMKMLAQDMFVRIADGDSYDRNSTIPVTIVPKGTRITFEV